jgi:hypothetical protein
MTDRPSHIWPSFQEKLSAMEHGELDREQEAEVYQELVDTGLIEKMEVHYQKRAQTLVDVGLVRKDPTKTPLRKAWPGE